MFLSNRISYFSDKIKIMSYKSNPLLRHSVLNVRNKSVDVKKSMDSDSDASDDVEIETSAEVVVLVGDVTTMERVGKKKEKKE